MTKLSPAQQRIIDAMRDGWDLRSMASPESGAWLARVVEDRRGQRLERRSVSEVSVSRLYKLGLIEYEKRWPLCRWKLTGEEQKERAAK